LSGESATRTRAPLALKTYRTAPIPNDRSFGDADDEFAFIVIID
jgi:hypothetical protein